MRAYFSDRFALPLPAGHRFPMTKYTRLREALEANSPELALCEAPAADEAQLALVHEAGWIQRMLRGGLSPREQGAIGFPWSPAMAERSLRSVGATLAACEAARNDGFSANLAGGTHHAYADRGEGFCCFNDFAVAARWVQAQGWAKQVLIVDLDVHQGNGSARIFREDSSVFTLSIHGARNFPFSKELGDADYALPDGTADEAYLATLERALDETARRFRADWVLYLAGADVYRGDRLGRLALSAEAIARRDEAVMRWCLAAGLPCVIAMGGGYADPIDETVAIHAQTVRLALRYASSRPGPDHNVPSVGELPQFSVDAHAVQHGPRA